VKITVLKKLKTDDVFQKYAEGNVEDECPLVDLDRQYIVNERMEMPEGFCSWAWADIQRDVAHLALGGDFPWIRDEGTMLSCCTDGLRPVVFKLERTKE